jgi:hypothetical protein
LRDGHAGQPQGKLLKHIVELFASGRRISEGLADGFGEYRRAYAQHPGAVANLVDRLRQKTGQRIVGGIKIIDHQDISSSNW